MRLVEIDVVGTEAAEARVDRALDRVAVEGRLAVCARRPGTSRRSGPAILVATITASRDWRRNHLPTISSVRPADVAVGGTG